MRLYGDQSKRYSRIYVSGPLGCNDKLLIDVSEKDKLLADWKTARGVKDSEAMS